VTHRICWRVLANRVFFVFHLNEQDSIRQPNRTRTRLLLPFRLTIAIQSTHTAVKMSFFDLVSKENDQHSKSVSDSFKTKKSGAISFTAIALTVPKKSEYKWLDPKSKAEKIIVSYRLLVSPLNLADAELPAATAPVLTDTKDDAGDQMIFTRIGDDKIVIKTARRLIATLAEDSGIWIDVNNCSLTLKPGTVVNVANLSWKEASKINLDTNLPWVNTKGDDVVANTSAEYHWVQIAKRVKAAALNIANRPIEYPFDMLAKNAGRLGYPLYLKSDGSEAFNNEPGSILKVVGLDNEESYFYEKNGEKDKKQCLKASLTLRMWQDMKWKTDAGDNQKLALENYQKLAACDIEMMNWPSAAVQSGITDVNTWRAVMPKQEGLVWISYAQVDKKRTTEIINNYADSHSFKLSMSSVWLFADWVDYLTKYALHVTGEYAKQMVREDPNSGTRYPDNPYNEAPGLDFVNLNEYRGNTDAIFGDGADEYRFFVIGDYDPLTSKGDVDYLKTCSDADCDAILKGENKDLAIRNIAKKTKVLFAVKRSLIEHWDEPPALTGAKRKAADGAIATSAPSDKKEARTE
jgi:hypothetical protein